MDLPRCAPPSKHLTIVSYVTTRQLRITDACFINKLLSPKLLDQTNTNPQQPKTAASSSYNRTPGPPFLHNPKVNYTSDSGDPHVLG
jgi:hypothetical protein